jgi:hypothetical protein
MKYAIIENGVVTNVVVAEADYAAQQGWIECNAVNPGWKYDGTTFTEPDPVLAPQPAPAPTKEQLMAELAALTAKIQALE